MFGRDHVQGHGPDGLTVGGESHTPLIPVPWIAPAGLKGGDDLLCYLREGWDALLDPALVERVAPIG